MKNQWIIISFAVAIFLAIGSYFVLIPDWTISLFIVFPIALVLMLIRNPELVFFRAFILIMSIFLVLNKFFFKLDGQTGDYKFQIGSNELGTGENIGLLILAFLSLILHFLKTTGKLEGTFFDFRQNKIGNISGNNNQINQNN